MSFRVNPRPSKYIVFEQDGGADQYWSKKTTYDDLLFAHGQHAKDYVDLSHLGKSLYYSKMGITESTALSPLMEYITGDGGVETVDKQFVRWRLYGEPEHRAQSWGNLNQTEYIGEGGNTFYLWLDVDWFGEGDLLSPLVNKRIQVQIEGDPSPVDGGWRYEAQLLDDDDDAFLNPDLMDAGNYWLKVGGGTGWEMMGEASSIQFGEGFSYIEFEVPLNRMAWTFEVEAEAHRQWGNIRVQVVDDEERPIIDKQTNYLEMKALAQIDMEKEYVLMWGSQAKNMIDKRSGKPKMFGPSLGEFQEEGNIIPISPDKKGVSSIVTHVEAHWFDRIPINQRDITFLTGQLGLKLWSEWVESEFGNTAATYTYDFILKQRQPYDDNNGRDGYAYNKPQFVEYVLPTFGTVRVAHWPLLDNTRINTVTFPGTFYPVTSAEFHAFNTGFGEPNVKFLQRDDNLIQTYIPGLWSPFGAVGPDNPMFKNPTYMEESYKWLHTESFGVMMMDPSCSIKFVPNLVY